MIKPNLKNDDVLIIWGDQRRKVKSKFVEQF